MLVIDGPKIMTTATTTRNDRQGTNLYASTMAFTFTQPFVFSNETHTTFLTAFSSSFYMTATVNAKKLPLSSRALD